MEQLPVRQGGTRSGRPWDELKEKIKNRTIYLGPEAYSVYTTTYSVLQGMTPDGVTEEDVPIKIDVTYNLIK